MKSFPIFAEKICLHLRALHFRVFTSDGFRKMVNIDSGGLKGTKDDIEFYHNFFVRDQESMLEFIKRKATSHTRVSLTTSNKLLYKYLNRVSWKMYTRLE